MIGVHGPALSTVNPTSCAIYESHGTPVEPRSLYLKQLELRLDGVPAWWATGRVGLGVGLGLGVGSTLSPTPSPQPQPHA